jgi:hypothetical protein
MSHIPPKETREAFKKRMLIQAAIIKQLSPLLPFPSPPLEETGLENIAVTTESESFNIYRQAPIEWAASARTKASGTHPSGLLGPLRVTLTWDLDRILVTWKPVTSRRNTKFFFQFYHHDHDQPRTKPFEVAVTHCRWSIPTEQLGFPVRDGWILRLTIKTE